MIEQNPNTPVDPNAPVEEAPKEVVVDVPEKPTDAPEEQPNMLERAGQFLSEEVVDPVVGAVEGAVEAVDKTLGEVFEVTPQGVAEAESIAGDIVMMGPMQAAKNAMQQQDVDKSYERQVAFSRENAVMLSRFDDQGDFHRLLKDPDTRKNSRFKIADVTNSVNRDQYILALKFYQEFLAPEDEKFSYGLEGNRNDYDAAENAYLSLLQTFDDTRQAFAEKYTGKLVTFVDPETNEFYEEYPEFINKKFNIKTAEGEAANFSRQLSEFVSTKIRPDNSDQSALIADALALRFSGGDPVIEAGRTAGQIAIGVPSLIYQAYEMASNFINPFKAFQLFVPRIRAYLNKEGTDFETEGNLLLKDMQSKATEISQDVDNFIQSSDFLSFKNTLNNKIRDHTIKIRGEEYYDQFKDDLTLSKQEAERILKFSSHSTTLGLTASYTVEAMSFLLGINKLTALRSRSLKEAIGIERAALQAQYRSLPYRDIQKQISESKLNHIKSKYPIISTIYRLTMPKARAENRMNLGLSLMQNSKIPPSMSKKINDLTERRAKLTLQSGSEESIRKIDEMIDAAYDDVLKFALKNSAKGSGMDPLLRRSLLEESGAAYTGALFLTLFDLNQSENADIYAMLPMLGSSFAIGPSLDFVEQRAGFAIGDTINRLRRNMTYIDPEGEYAIPEELLMGIELPSRRFPEDYKKSDGSSLNQQEKEGVREFMRALRKLSPIAREMMVRGVKDSLRQKKNILAPFDAEIESLQQIIDGPAVARIDSSAPLDDQAPFSPVYNIDRGYEPDFQLFDESGNLIEYPSLPKESPEEMFAGPRGDGTPLPEVEIKPTTTTTDDLPPPLPTGGMSVEQATQRLEEVTELRQKAEQGLELVLGNMSGVMAFSGYMNTRLSKASLSMGDFRSYGDRLTQMVKDQVNAEETARGISSLIESLSSLTARGSVTGVSQDLERARTETIEALKRDKERFEESVIENDKLIISAVNDFAKTAESLFREGSIDIDMFDDAIAVKLEHMATQSARGAKTAQEALDKFRAEKEKFFQDANERFKESGINLTEILNDPDMTPGTLSNIVGNRMVDIFKNVHAKQLADNAEMYAPLDKYEDIDVGGALKEVVVQFTKYDIDSMAVFTPDMTGVVGTSRKVKRALSTAIEQSVVEHFKKGADTDDPEVLENMIKIIKEEQGDDIVSFISEQTGRTNFTKPQIKLTHVYAYAVEQGLSIPVNVSFEQLDLLRRQLKREVIQYRKDPTSPEYRSLSKTYENLDRDLREAGDKIVLDEATGKTVTNHLDQQSFKYELDHANRYDDAYNNTPSFRGELRKFIQANRERAGLGPDHLHNVVFGDRFVTRIAGKTEADRDKAGREFQQIISKAFGKATIKDETTGKYVDLDTYLTNNPDVSLENAQSLIQQKRVRYSLDDLSDEEFEEIRPQLTALMNSLFVESFGTAIDMGVKGTGKALRDKFKDSSRSWLFDLSDRFKEDGPRVLEEMKEAFSVQRNGETVYLIDPIDKVTATTENIASVVKDIGTRSEVYEYSKDEFKNIVEDIRFEALRDLNKESQKYMRVFENVPDNVGKMFESDDVVSQVESLIEYHVIKDGEENREFILQGLRAYFVQHLTDAVGNKANTTLKQVNRFGNDVPVSYLKTPEDLLEYLNSDTASNLMRVLEMDEDHALAMRDFAGFLMDVKNAQISGVSITDQYSPMSILSKASRLHNVIRGIVNPSYYVMEAGFNLMRKKNMDLMDFMITDKEGAKLAIAMMADASNFPTEDYRILGQRILAYAMAFGTGQKDYTTDASVAEQDVENLVEDAYNKMNEAFKGSIEEDEQQ